MRDEQAENVCRRLCDKCKQPVASDWKYALCKVCGEEPCKHGNQVEECNECLIESDCEFDAKREALDL